MKTSFKISNNGDFPKGLVCGQYGQENVFVDILDRENVCPDYKNKDIKKFEI